MTIINALIIFIAGFLAGTLNSVAGGGSFIGFPSLIYVNIPTVQANATNTAALWPASIASTWAYRKELFKQDKTLLLVLGGASLLGGIGGAFLLIKTPPAVFTHLISLLLLLATLLFAFSPIVTASLKKHSANKVKENLVGEELDQQRPKRSVGSLVLIGFIQILISVYGGYFGGGIGILMLASLGIMGMENIHEMNAVKNTLASCINGVATVTFIIYGFVVWLAALIMVVGAVMGGFGGAYFARKLDQKWIRGFVILVGIATTIYFFYKYGLS